MKLKPVTNDCLRTAVLALTVVLLISLSSHAGRANKPATPLSRATTYSLVGEKIPVAKSTYTSNLVSPGVTVGYTYYDNQHLGSVGRMVETGPHSGVIDQAIVHFSFTYVPDVVGFELGYIYAAYNCYNSLDAAFMGLTPVGGPPGVGSSVNLDVTPDNRAAVGAHFKEEPGVGLFQPEVFFDLCPGCGIFDHSDRVPDNGEDEYMWPKFSFQMGTDTVLHILALLNDTDPVHTLTYFRKVGYEGAGVWDMPRVVDSVRNRSHVITGRRMSDDVAMAWLAHPPYQEPWCNTCSGIAEWTEPLMNDMDNDVYYQVSHDQGATWQPRVNITKVGIGQAGYRAYCDCSILFDAPGNVHIIWAACPWPAIEPVGLDGYESISEFDPVKARLLHWSENVPAIRTICSREYESTDSCGPPLWALRVAKPSLSECDGKLYAIWTQFNDLANGIDNDCAQWGYDEDRYRGPANGEIWLSISEDDGLCWDAARNLTNTYTPHCDPDMGYNCESDYWATMSSYGKQTQSGENWSGAVVVDPSGGSFPTDYFLDIQYVEDHCAGGIDQEEPEGVWTNNPVKWFRIPCVERVPNPVFVAEWMFYGDPNYCHPAATKMVPLTFENVGNETLNYVISVIEDNGPAGWLSHAGFFNSIPCGFGNIAPGTVILNVGGIITTPGTYYGRLHIDGNDPANLPCDIEIELIVVDTVCPPFLDTVNTDCLALAVSNTGNIGNDGVGKANMDFYPEDCDPNATVYLFDGSPLIGRGTAPDVSFDLSMWGVDWLDDNGLRPQCGESPTIYCEGLNAEVFESGPVTTQDSTIAFEKIWVAPLDDCEFIIQYTRFWGWDGLPHDDLVLGEAVDWDIPGDDVTSGGQVVHASANTSGFDPPRNLLYLQGYEEDLAGCQGNDERFGGLAFFESYLNGSLRHPFPGCAFVAENDSLQGDKGFRDDVLYNEMMIPGFWITDSVEDLHIVMTYEAEIDLGGTDYYEVVTALVAVEQGTLTDLQNAVDRANAWYASHGGMSMFADANDDGQIDVCCNSSCCNLMGDLNSDDEFNPLDAVYFVVWLWMSGPPPACLAEADADGSCDVNPLDAVEIVNYLWLGGEPISCSCNLACWGNECGCCLDVGDFNHNCIITETDIDDYIEYLFNAGAPPPCYEEADCNGDGFHTPIDIDILVQWLLHGGPPPVPCPY